MPVFIPVASTSISGVGYDPEARELYVKFRPSGTYVYSGVSEFVFRHLLMAPSKGEFINQEVRDAFEFRKLPTEWSP